MVKVGIKLPRGAKAQAKRDGFTFVKYGRELHYRLKKKSNPKIVENNQHFAQISKDLSNQYKALSESEKDALIKRMKKEGKTKNAWVQFLRENWEGGADVNIRVPS